MKPALSYLMVLFLVFWSSILNAQDSMLSPGLQKMWTLQEGLTVPESSYYNLFTKTIFVSNIVGMHNIKDSTGYISILNDKGEIITKDWVTGLNAPKGIACSKKSLFVTDIDRVLEINLKTGKIVKTYRNRLSKSLNDVTVATDGQIYISDSGGDCIFQIGKDSLEVFLQSSQLARMNGVLAVDNLLYMGSNGNFISIDRKSKKITILAENVGYLDGIVMIDKNKFITSDFKGKVQFIEPGKGFKELMNTTEQQINAADLGFIPVQNLLLVPTFNDNKLNAFKIKWERK